MAVDPIDRDILNLLSMQSWTNPTVLVQEKHSLSRQAVTKRLNKLVYLGVIDRSGERRGTKYRLRSDPTKLTWQLSHHKLQEQGEDRVYDELISPVIIHLADNVQQIVKHIVTEMLNNVIDHSQAQQVCIYLQHKQESLEISIKDDGIGVFASIHKGFQLENLSEAIGELLKGKRTTDPENHAGEGLFFSMRLADVFSIFANQIEFIFDAVRDDWTVKSGKEDPGTQIVFRIGSESKRSIKAVFEEYTDEDFEFSKNRPFFVKPYLLELKTPMLSRSEAKRFIAGAENAQLIVIDFKSVDAIGQGFADEIFRVWAGKNPKVHIQFRNSNDFIDLMIARVNPKNNVEKVFADKPV